MDKNINPGPEKTSINILSNNSQPTIAIE